MADEMFQEEYTRRTRGSLHSSYMPSTANNNIRYMDMQRNRSNIRQRHHKSMHDGMEYARQTQESLHSNNNNIRYLKDERTRIEMDLRKMQQHPSQMRHDTTPTGQGEEYNTRHHAQSSLHSHLPPPSNKNNNNNVQNTHYYLEDQRNRIEMDLKRQHPSRQMAADEDADEVVIPRRLPIRSSPTTATTNSSSNNSRTSSVSPKRRKNKQKKNYAKRQNLIQRGRALIQRGRKKEQKTSDIDLVTSNFSIDDGSFIDDLRRSILEEEALRQKELKPKYNYTTTGNYRQLKHALDRRHEKEEEDRAPSTKSFSSNDRDQSTTNLSLQNNVEREPAPKARTVPAHSKIGTVSSRIQQWEQGAISSYSSSNSSRRSDQRSTNQSEESSKDVRQRTQERLLHLKQFIQDHDAQHNTTTTAAADATNAAPAVEEMDVTDYMSVQTPSPPSHAASDERTRSTESKEQTSQQEKKKQISPVPQATGTLGISSGFPFPQDTDIAIGTSSCNVSEVTNTVSSSEEAEQRQIPPSLGAQPMLSDPPMPSESLAVDPALELIKSFDDMNQMLPKPKASKSPATEHNDTIQSSSSSSNERKSKPPIVPTEFKSTPAQQPTPLNEKEDEREQHEYIASTQGRHAEPLRSLMDFDSQEESSLDRPSINIIDQPPAVPVYSKMSIVGSNSNNSSDGIQTIAREDSDPKEYSKEEQPVAAHTKAMALANVNNTPPHPSAPIGEAERRDIHNVQAEAEQHNALVPPSTQKTENEVVDDEYDPLDQVIVEVSSTLTDSQQGRKIVASPSKATAKLLKFHKENKLTPSLRRSKTALINPDGDDSVDMSISYKDEASFDSRQSVNGTDERIWRMDPLDSLSDFILQIRDKDICKTTAYHVHKHRLACGPRKSAYLEKWFKECSTSSTHVSFCSKACEVFPLVLDFMYCDGFELEFTTTTVVIYRLIGYELKIHSLVARTTKFIREDMQVGNMTSYVSDMEAHGNLGMKKIVAEKCASKIQHISELDSLWIVMDPDLFCETVSCKLIDRTKHSQHLSILVAEYTALHKHEMSQAMFGQLSTSAIIPKIARESALPLLEICFSYGSPREFEGLQKRCALTMATYWKITNENDRQRLFALLRNLPSSYTVDFLEKVDTGKMTSLLNFSPSEEYQHVEDGPIGDGFEKENTFDMEEDETEYEGWRLDPDLSYSDWVIRVKSSTKSSAEAYYVHKHVLAVGKQKSAFFASVFSSNRNQSVTRGSTSVSLDQDAAKVFPRMLDFIYSKGKTLDICTQTILPLRFLARTFQVYALNQEIIEFLKRDLSVDNVSKYLQNADSFNDKGITGVVIDFVAANIEQVDIDSDLLNELEPSIFRRIISSEAIDRSASESYHVPILIAKYFYIHELDEKLLEDILSHYDMEQLDCLNALKLLQIICRLDLKESSFFLSLRDKCTDVLTDSWDDFRDSFRNEVFAIMLTLDTETVAQIFNKVENRCYNKLDEPSAEMRLIVPITDLQNHQNSGTEPKEFETRQEDEGGNIIMPPASAANQIKQEYSEHRQPTPTDERIPSHISVPSAAPSEEMRATNMASGPSEEMRSQTMTTLPSKELWTNTMGSSPPDEIIVNQDAAPSPSCQIFSCGLMANE